MRYHVIYSVFCIMLYVARSSGQLFGEVIEISKSRNFPVVGLGEYTRETVTIMSGKILQSPTSKGHPSRSLFSIPTSDFDDRAKSGRLPKSSERNHYRRNNVSVFSNEESSNNQSADDHAIRKNLRRNADILTDENILENEGKRSLNGKERGWGGSEKSISPVWQVRESPETSKVSSSSSLIPEFHLNKSANREDRREDKISRRRQPKKLVLSKDDVFVGHPGRYDPIIAKRNFIPGSFENNISKRYVYERNPQNNDLVRNDLRRKSEIENLKRNTYGRNVSASRISGGPYILENYAPGQTLHLRGKFKRGFQLVPVAQNLYALREDSQNVEVRSLPDDASSNFIDTLKKPEPFLIANDNYETRRGDRTSDMLSFKAHLHHNVKNIGNNFRRKAADQNLPFFNSDDLSVSSPESWNVPDTLDTSGSLQMEPLRYAPSEFFEKNLPNYNQAQNFPQFVDYPSNSLTNDRSVLDNIELYGGNNLLYNANPRMAGTQYVPPLSSLQNQNPDSQYFIDKFSDNRLPYEKRKVSDFSNLIYSEPDEDNVMYEAPLSVDQNQWMGNADYAVPRNSFSKTDNLEREVRQNSDETSTYHLKYLNEYARALNLMSENYYNDLDDISSQVDDQSDGDKDVGEKEAILESPNMDDSSVQSQESLGDNNRDISGQNGNAVNTRDISSSYDDQIEPPLASSKTLSVFNANAYEYPNPSYIPQRILNSRPSDDNIIDTPTVSSSIQEEKTTTDAHQQGNKMKGKSFSNVIEPLTAQLQKLLSTIKLVNENLTKEGNSGQQSEGSVDNKRGIASSDKTRKKRHHEVYPNDLVDGDSVKNNLPIENKLQPDEKRSDGTFGHQDDRNFQRPIALNQDKGCGDGKRKRNPGIMDFIEKALGFETKDHDSTAETAGTTFEATHSESTDVETTESVAQTTNARSTIAEEYSSASEVTIETSGSFTGSISTDSTVQKNLSNTDSSMQIYEKTTTFVSRPKEITVYSIETTISRMTEYGKTEETEEIDEIPTDQYRTQEKMRITVLPSSKIVQDTTHGRNFSSFSSENDNASPVTALRTNVHKNVSEISTDRHDRTTLRNIPSAQNHRTILQGHSKHQEPARPAVPIIRNNISHLPDEQIFPVTNESKDFRPESKNSSLNQLFTSRKIEMFDNNHQNDSHVKTSKITTPATVLKASSTESSSQPVEQSIGHSEHQKAHEYGAQELLVKLLASEIIRNITNTIPAQTKSTSTQRFPESSKEEMFEQKINKIVLTPPRSYASTSDYQTTRKSESQVTVGGSTVRVSNAQDGRNASMEPEITQPRNHGIDISRNYLPIFSKTSKTKTNGEASVAASADGIGDNARVDIRLKIPIHHSQNRRKIVSRGSKKRKCTRSENRENPVKDDRNKDLLKRSSDQDYENVDDDNENLSDYDLFSARDYDLQGSNSPDAEQIYADAYLKDHEYGEVYEDDYDPEETANDEMYRSLRNNDDDTEKKSGIKKNLHTSKLHIWPEHIDRESLSKLDSIDASGRDASIPLYQPPKRPHGDKNDKKNRLKNKQVSPKKKKTRRPQIFSENAKSIKVSNFDRPDYVRLGRKLHAVKCNRKLLSINELEDLSILDDDVIEELLLTPIQEAKMSEETSITKKPTISYPINPVITQRIPFQSYRDLRKIGENTEIKTEETDSFDESIGTIITPKTSQKLATITVCKCSRSVEPLKNVTLQTPSRKPSTTEESSSVGSDENTSTLEEVERTTEEIKCTTELTSTEAEIIEKTEQSSTKFTASTNMSVSEITDTTGTEEPEDVTVSTFKMTTTMSSTESESSSPSITETAIMTLADTVTAPKTTATLSMIDAMISSETDSIPLNVSVTSDFTTVESSSDTEETLVTTTLSEEVTTNLFKSETIMSLTPETETTESIISKIQGKGTGIPLEEEIQTTETIHPENAEIVLATTIKTHFPTDTSEINVDATESTEMMTSAKQTEKTMLETIMETPDVMSSSEDITDSATSDVPKTNTELLNSTETGTTVSKELLSSMTESTVNEFMATESTITDSTVSLMTELTMTEFPMTESLVTQSTVIDSIESLPMEPTTTEFIISESTESTITELTESTVKEFTTTESMTTQFAITESTESLMTKPTVTDSGTNMSTMTEGTNTHPMTTQSIITESIESLTIEATTPESTISESVKSTITESTDLTVKEFTTMKSITMESTTPESTISESVKSTTTESTDLTVKEFTTMESITMESTITQSIVPLMTESTVTKATTKGSTMTEAITTQFGITESIESPTTEPTTTDSTVTQSTVPLMTESTVMEDVTITESTMTESTTTESTMTESTTTEAMTTQSALTLSTESSTMEPTTTEALTTQFALTESIESLTTRSTVSEFILTQSTTTGSTESTITKSTESTMTEFKISESTMTESAITESTITTITESTEPTITESTEPTITESTESTITESTESTITESTESTITESSMTESTMTESTMTESTITESTRIESTTTESTMSEFMTTESTIEGLTGSKMAESTTMYSVSSDSTTTESPKFAVTISTIMSTVMTTESNTMSKTTGKEEPDRKTTVPLAQISKVTVDTDHTTETTHGIPEITTSQATSTDSEPSEATLPSSLQMTTEAEIIIEITEETTKGRHYTKTPPHASTPKIERPTTITTTVHADEDYQETSTIPESPKVSTLGGKTATSSSTELTESETSESEETITFSDSVSSSEYAEMSTENISCTTETFITVMSELENESASPTIVSVSTEETETSSSHIDSSSEIISGEQKTATKIGKGDVSTIEETVTSEETISSASGGEFSDSSESTEKSTPEIESTSELSSERSTITGEVSQERYTTFDEKTVKTSSRLELTTSAGETPIETSRETEKPEYSVRTESSIMPETEGTDESEVFTETTERHEKTKISTEINATAISTLSTTSFQTFLSFETTGESSPLVSLTDTTLKEGEEGKEAGQTGPRRTTEERTMFTKDDYIDTTTLPTFLKNTTHGGKKEPTTKTTTESDESMTLPGSLGPPEDTTLTPSKGTASTKILEETVSNEISMTIKGDTSTFETSPTAEMETATQTTGTSIEVDVTTKDTGETISSTGETDHFTSRSGPTDEFTGDTESTVESTTGGELTAEFTSKSEPTDEFSITSELTQKSMGESSILTGTFSITQNVTSSSHQETSLITIEQITSTESSESVSRKSFDTEKTTRIYSTDVSEITSVLMESELGVTPSISPTDSGFETTSSTEGYHDDAETYETITEIDAELETVGYNESSEEYDTGKTGKWSDYEESTEGITSAYETKSTEKSLEDMTLSEPFEVTTKESEEITVSSARVLISEEIGDQDGVSTAILDTSITQDDELQMKKYEDSPQVKSGNHSQLKDAASKISDMKTLKAEEQKLIEIEKQQLKRRRELEAYMKELQKREDAIKKREKQLEQKLKDLETKKAQADSKTRKTTPTEPLTSASISSDEILTTPTETSTAIEAMGSTKLPTSLEESMSETSTAIDEAISEELSTSLEELLSSTSESSITSDETLTIFTEKSTATEAMGSTELSSSSEESMSETSTAIDETISTELSGSSEEMRLSVSESAITSEEILTTSITLEDMTTTTTETMTTVDIVKVKELDERRRKNDDLEKKLDELEQKIKEKEKELDEREKALDIKEKELDKNLEKLEDEDTIESDTDSTIKHMNTEFSTIKPVIEASTGTPIPPVEETSVSTAGDIDEQTKGTKRCKSKRKKSKPSKKKDTKQPEDEESGKYVFDTEEEVWKEKQPEDCNVAPGKMAYEDGCRLTAKARKKANDKYVTQDVEDEEKNREYSDEEPTDKIIDDARGEPKDQETTNINDKDEDHEHDAGEKTDVKKTDVDREHTDETSKTAIDADEDRDHTEETLKTAIDADEDRKYTDETSETAIDADEDREHTDKASKTAIGADEDHKQIDEATANVADKDEDGVFTKEETTTDVEKSDRDSESDRDSKLTTSEMDEVWNQATKKVCLHVLQNDNLPAGLKKHSNDYVTEVVCLPYNPEEIHDGHRRRRGRVARKLMDHDDNYDTSRSGDFTVNPIKSDDPMVFLDKRYGNKIEKNMKMGCLNLLHHEWQNAGTTPSLHSHKGFTRTYESSTKEQKDDGNSLDDEDEEETSRNRRGENEHIELKTRIEEIYVKPDIHENKIHEKKINNEKKRVSDKVGFRIDDDVINDDGKVEDNDYLNRIKRISDDDFYKRNSEDEFLYDESEIPGVDRRNKPNKISWQKDRSEREIANDPVQIEAKRAKEIRKKVAKEEQELSRMEEKLLKKEASLTREEDKIDKAEKKIIAIEKSLELNTMENPSQRTNEGRRKILESEVGTSESWLTESIGGHQIDGQDDWDADDSDEENDDTFDRSKRAFTVNVLRLQYDEEEENHKVKHEKPNQEEMIGGDQETEENDNEYANKNEKIKNNEKIVSNESRDDKAIALKSKAARKKAKSRKPPGSQWPTEKTTKYHVGGTLTWVKELSERPSKLRKTRKATIIEDDDYYEREKRHDRHTTCYTVIVKSGKSHLNGKSNRHAKRMKKSEDQMERPRLMKIHQGHRWRTIDNKANKKLKLKRSSRMLKRDVLGRQLSGFEQSHEQVDRLNWEGRKNNPTFDNLFINRNNFFKNNNPKFRSIKSIEDSEVHENSECNGVEYENENIDNREHDEEYDDDEDDYHQAIRSESSTFFDDNSTTRIDDYDFFSAPTEDITTRVEEKTTAVLNTSLPESISTARVVQQSGIDEDKIVSNVSIFVATTEATIIRHLTEGQKSNFSENFVAAHATNTKDFRNGSITENRTPEDKDENNRFSEPQLATINETLKSEEITEDVTHSQTNEQLTVKISDGFDPHHSTIETFPNSDASNHHFFGEYADYGQDTKFEKAKSSIHNSEKNEDSSFYPKEHTNSINEENRESEEMLFDEKKMSKSLTQETGERIKWLNHDVVSKKKLPVLIRLDDEKLMELKNLREPPKEIYVVYKCGPPIIAGEYISTTPSKENKITTLKEMEMATMSVLPKKPEMTTINVLPEKVETTTVEETMSEVEGTTYDNNNINYSVQTSVDVVSDRKINFEVEETSLEPGDNDFVPLCGGFVDTEFAQSLTGDTAKKTMKETSELFGNFGESTMNLNGITTELEKHISSTENAKGIKARKHPNARSSVRDSIETEKNEDNAPITVGSENRILDFSNARKRQSPLKKIISRKKKSGHVKELSKNSGKNDKEKRPQKSRIRSSRSIDSSLNDTSIESWEAEVNLESTEESKFKLEDRGINDDTDSFYDIIERDDRNYHYTPDYEVFDGADKTGRSLLGFDKSSISSEETSNNRNKKESSMKIRGKKENMKRKTKSSNPIKLKLRNLRDLGKKSLNNDERAEFRKSPALDSGVLEVNGNSVETSSLLDKVMDMINPKSDSDKISPEDASSRAATREKIKENKPRSLLEKVKDIISNAIGVRKKNKTEMSTEIVNDSAIITSSTMSPEYVEMKNLLYDTERIVSSLKQLVKDERAAHSVNSKQDSLRGHPQRSYSSEDAIEQQSSQPKPKTVPAEPKSKAPKIKPTKRQKNVKKKLPKTQKSKRRKPNTGKKKSRKNPQKKGDSKTELANNKTLGASHSQLVESNSQDDVATKNPNNKKAHRKLVFKQASKKLNTSDIIPRVRELVEQQNLGNVEKIIIYVDQNEEKHKSRSAKNYSAKNLDSSLHGNRASERQVISKKKAKSRSTPFSSKSDESLKKRSFDVDPIDKDSAMNLRDDSDFHEPNLADYDDENFSDQLKNGELSFDGVPLDKIVSRVANEILQSPVHSGKFSRTLDPRISVKVIQEVANGTELPHEEIRTEFLLDMFGKPIPSKTKSKESGKTGRLTSKTSERRMDLPDVPGKNRRRNWKKKIRRDEEAIRERNSDIIRRRLLRELRKKLRQRRLSSSPINSRIRRSLSRKSSDKNHAKMFPTYHKDRAIDEKIRLIYALQHKNARKRKKNHWQNIFSSQRPMHQSVFVKKQSAKHRPKRENNFRYDEPYATRDEDNINPYDENLIDFENPKEIPRLDPIYKIEQFLQPNQRQVRHNSNMEIESKNDEMIIKNVSDISSMNKSFIDNTDNQKLLKKSKMNVPKSANDIESVKQKTLQDKISSDDALFYNHIFDLEKQLLTKSNLSLKNSSDFSGVQNTKFSESMCPGNLKNICRTKFERIKKIVHAGAHYLLHHFDDCRHCQYDVTKSKNNISSSPVKTKREDHSKRDVEKMAEKILHFASKIDAQRDSEKKNRKMHHDEVDKLVEKFGIDELGLTSEEDKKSLAELVNEIVNVQKNVNRTLEIIRTRLGSGSKNATNQKKFKTKSRSKGKSGKKNNKEKEKKDEKEHRKNVKVKIIEREEKKKTKDKKIHEAKGKKKKVKKSVLGQRNITETNFASTDKKKLEVKLNPDKQLDGIGEEIRQILTEENDRESNVSVHHEEQINANSSRATRNPKKISENHDFFPRFARDIDDTNIANFGKYRIRRVRSSAWNQNDLPSDDHDTLIYKNFATFLDLTNVNLDYAKRKANNTNKRRSFDNSTIVDPKFLSKQHDPLYPRPLNVRSTAKHVSSQKSRKKNGTKKNEKTQFTSNKKSTKKSKRIHEKHHHPRKKDKNKVSKAASGLTTTKKHIDSKKTSTASTKDNDNQMIKLKLTGRINIAEQPFNNGDTPKIRTPHFSARRKLQSSFHMVARKNSSSGKSISRENEESAERKKMMKRSANQNSNSGRKNRNTHKSGHERESQTVIPIKNRHIRIKYIYRNVTQLPEDRTHRIIRPKMRSTARKVRKDEIINFQNQQKATLTSAPATGHLIRKTNCASCICDLMETIEDLRKILTMRGDTLLKVIDYECSKYEDIGDEIILVSTGIIGDVLPRSRRDLAEAKGMEYVKSEDLHDLLKDEVNNDEKNELISFPGNDLNVPCTHDGEDITWLTSMSKPNYTWTRNDGLPVSGLMRKNGNLELYDVDVKDSGNYTCYVSYIDPDNEELVQNLYVHRIQVVTLPRYTLRGGNRYMMENCDETALDVLASHLPKKLNDILCKASTCDAFIYAPRCYHNQISIRTLILPSSIVKLFPIGTNQCGYQCRKALQDKVTLIMSKNLRNVLEKSIVFRLPHRSEDRLIPIVDEPKISRNKRTGGRNERNGDADGEVGLLVGCPAGYGLRVSHCVPCLPGTHSDNLGSRCKRCSTGTYQPNAGARTCRACTNPFVEGCYRMFWNSSSAVMAILVSLCAVITIFMILVWMLCCGKGRKTRSDVSCVRSTEVDLKYQPGIADQSLRQPLIDRYRDLTEEDERCCDCEKIRRKKKRFLRRKLLAKEDWQEIPPHQPTERRQRVVKERTDQKVERVRTIPISCIGSYRSHGGGHYRNNSPKRYDYSKPPLPLPDFPR